MNSVLALVCVFLCASFYTLQADLVFNVEPGTVNYQLHKYICNYKAQTEVYEVLAYGFQTDVASYNFTYVDYNSKNKVTVQRVDYEGDGTEYTVTFNGNQVVIYALWDHDAQNYDVCCKSSAFGLAKDAFRERINLNITSDLHYTVKSWKPKLQQLSC